eukprot:CAMPEP_0172414302 /NCGR_PEP_ID=MMETSP1064-20121228/977_1 /TAXON_ID=202472 /ORGANISM="Aulacoseira subarctica , Strain CCAP 1002/5" /LENGTH=74 /DNA_ID=CAMNT_0013150907 /DNA_START=16 /DNA_END=236 /DNA_ORIENTATION=+
MARVRPSSSSPSQAASKKGNAKKPKAIAANGASGGAVSKANKTKPAAVDGRTSTSTTTDSTTAAAKAKKTKPAL